MSKKISEICGKKYVPSELATLVFVCQGEPNKTGEQQKIDKISFIKRDQSTTSSPNPKISTHNKNQPTRKKRIKNSRIISTSDPSQARSKLQAYNNEIS